MCGLDDGEELEADRGDAPEMTGPKVALQAVGRAFDRDPRRVVRAGTSPSTVGREQQVDARLLGDPGVARLVARIRGQVGGIAELCSD